MYSAKRTALHSYEHFAWRSLVGLAAVIAAATGFGLLLLLVRWNWPPLASFDRHAVDALNHVVAGRRAAVAALTAITPTPLPPSTMRWAEPLYRILYDPDGRPWPLRREGAF